ncbi:WhiB family transcriptional regulator [Streptomyces sp. HNM0645]|uniref:WhiB family transcriptional regulator n=1 Tax=Streptomyces sp. HNM0645 TaxID=2782343 RepID=UPI0024B7D5AF|nr:WhiB family transcriptional regulator [Streptomyces sp. HNM0645]MDI9885345.1 WhiB family transcriptional regulator [Streptomyces sp. HNM0645]
MTGRAPDTLERPGAWRQNAACREAGTDPEVFFVDTVNRRTVETAKAICRRCPVAARCLIDAMNAERASARWGIFGGATHGQRRRISERMDRTGQSLPDAATAFVERLHREDDPLGEAYAMRTEELDDGHVRWTVVTSVLTIAGHVYTPARLAFILAHGRKPDGMVRTTCGMPGCVAFDHLADTGMRKAARQATAV